MAKEGQMAKSTLLAFSLLFLGGCSSWVTPQPVSSALKPFVTQASPAEETTLSEPLTLGVAWLTPSSIDVALPKRGTQQIFKQIQNHFSQPGMALQISKIDPVTSIDLTTLRDLGKKQGVDHMLIVAPTLQEITVPERFAVQRNTWLGTRTESRVFLEAVAIDLNSGSPLFEAQANGQASLEVLDYGSFGDFPRIFRGLYAPGDGAIFFPEGGKEDFRPGEVRVVASNYAVAGLLSKLGMIKTTNPS